MIVLLALLPVLVLSAPATIDWSICGKEAICYCPTSLDSLKLESKTTDTLDADKIKEHCRQVGIQQKYFGDRIAIFQMHVTGQPNLKKLMLFHDTKELFGCTFSDGKPELSLVHDPQNSLKSIKAKSLFENLSYFTSGNALCAVKVGEANKLIGKLYQEFQNGKNTKMIVSAASETTYEVQTTGIELFRVKKALCNPFAFKENPILLTHKIQPLENRDRAILMCEDEHYTMRYMNSSVLDSEEMEKLECKKDVAGEDFFYYMHRSGAEPEKILEPQLYYFFCAANFDEICPNPTIGCAEGSSECPEFKKGQRGSKAELSCKTKWVINGVFTTLNDEPVCKKNDRSSTSEVAFQYKLANGNYEAIKPTDRCFTDYDCRKHSQLVLLCADANVCNLVDQSDGQIKCMNESATLTVMMKNNVTWNTTSSYQCNNATGKYENGTQVIPPKSRVRCIPTPVVHTAPVKAAENMSELTIYGIIGGFLLLAIICVIVVYMVVSRRRKKRSRLEVKGRGEWRKLKSKLRIAHCRAAFATILTATPDKSDSLIAGLDLIETMLDADTEEVECWEEAYKFLMRVQGSVARLDHGIWRMFSRYAYLEARKIIDKHGWLAPAPIRNNARKGLIRTVAIQLLSFSLFDPTNTEAEELLIAGFQQLQYNAIEQYPHCGLLWSTLLHTRPLGRRAPDSRIVKFDRAKFLENMDAVMRTELKVIPKDEVIAEFGSLQYQGAYAIGAAPVMEKASSIWGDMCRCDEGSVQRGYYAGMGDSVARDPVPTILLSCDMQKEVKAGFWKDLMRNAPPKAFWHARTMKTMMIALYYGRAMDAKRLQSRFFADDKDADATFNKLQLEQQDFHDAVQYALEPLRKWFAKRTDKAELKKRPIYPEGDKFKLDARITEAKHVEGENKSTSNTAESPGPAAAGNKTPTAAAADPAVTPVLEPASPASPAAAAAPREPAGAETPGQSAKDSQVESQKPSEKPSEKPSAKATEKEDPPDAYYHYGKEPAWPADMCGLEEIPGATVWEGPQRVRATQLTAEEQARFRGYLARIFDPETIIGRRVIFPPEEIVDVIDAVIPLLDSEPTLIEDVPFDVIIVGDVHGQLFDLDRVFAAHARDGRPGWENMKFLFMGDYVDRGRQSIEVIMALFIIKCLHPDQIFLLRGNHEFHNVNQTHGFLLECEYSYAEREVAKQVYVLFNEAFFYLSVAAIVGNSYFCAHAGISTTGFTRRQMRGIYKPMVTHFEERVVHDITWSDPVGGLRGSAFNKERNTSIFFGFDELCKALASMDVVAIFRGHTRLDEGYEASWNCCHTVFTATSADFTNSNGAVAHVGPTGKIKIHILEEDPKRAEFEKKLRAIEYGIDETPEEEKTQDPDHGTGHINN